MSTFRSILMLLSLLASLAWMYGARTSFITPINPLSDLPQVAIAGLVFASVLGLFPLLFLDGLVSLLPRAWTQNSLPRPTKRPCIPLLKAWPICLILGFAIALLIAAAEERSFISSSKVHFAATPNATHHFQTRLWPFEASGMVIDRSGRTSVHD
jgi:hypothetical protein